MASFTDKANALEAALVQKDLPALTVKLHQLAGSSGSYGFVELSERCALIEGMAQETGQLSQAIEQQTIELIQRLRQSQVQP